MFQFLEDHHIDPETELHLLSKLMDFEAQTIYPKSLDQHTTTELKFEISPNDLLYNIIEVRRATRGMHLAQIGYPPEPNLPVSDTMSSSLKLTGSESR